MDGGFDLDLSRSFQGAGDIWGLSDHCQSFIRDAWHGFAPPGSCTIVPLPPDVSGPQNNPWHAHSIAIVPTMRTPEDVSWHQDLVYNSMWALLVGITRWNETTCGGGDERPHGSKGS
ncbi:hypothetical protein A0H81_08525 [Grifola frondosa]|uniref:Uncharacterized protein n=1 Tax=Grifola frondosa TaxID=5627 RepID=A0A1C7M465_GRIFR|nr:hypothetical protein A0H81_08525 [Grifola frondosa]